MNAGHGEQGEVGSGVARDDPRAAGGRPGEGSIRHRMLDRDDLTGRDREPDRTLTSRVEYG
jgi:hypothetical protein